MLGYYWVYLVLAAAFLFQVYVTVRIWRCQSFENPQKRSQSQLVWMIPVLGAAIVFSAILEEEKYASGAYKHDDSERRG